MTSRYLSVPSDGKRGWRVALAVLAVALAVGAGAWSLSSFSDGEQAGASVRKAVLDAALQCQAVEGAYPPSLSYLEENYGLRVNQADYVVLYEWFASNVPPSVVVRPR